MKTRSRFAPLSLMAVAAVTLFSLAGSAMAESTQGTPGLVDAYRAQQAIIKDMRAGNVARPAQETLNILVARGVELMAANGEAKLARKLGKEWKTNFSRYLTTYAVPDASSLTGFVILDLGDHDALSPWLANFYTTMSAKTGGVLGAIQILRDINDMNYALAVVIRPKSKVWKSGESYQADQWEYRKHFIPMANIVSYWVALEACKYATKSLPQLKRLCSPAANKLKFYMGRYWAPKLSDWVYAKANGADVSRQSSFIAGSANDADFMSEAQFENTILSSRI